MPAAEGLAVEKRQGAVVAVVVERQVLTLAVLAAQVGRVWEA